MACSLLNIFRWFTIRSISCPPFPVSVTIFSQVAYSSILKMTAATANIYYTTWHYIPEDSIIWEYHDPQTQD
jgi:hypothetical protein